MTKTTKIIISIAAIIIVISLVVSGSKNSKKSDTFTLGAALPLSGPSALWGETVKNGMDLALEGKKNIKVVYEDSKGMPADGISAFNALQLKNVDLTLSALSSVSVPLSKIALEKKIPLFVTLVAASSSIIVNDYTTRYYTDPAHYAGPSFTSDISPVVKANKIAVLYRNDELGASVRDEIQKLSVQYGKKIVYIDSFKPAETDFSTLVSKVKSSGAEVMIFVPTTPGEAIGIVTDANKLKLSIPMVEAGAVFADLDNRKKVENISLYSTSYDFSIDSEKAREFRNTYKTKFGKEPNFAAAFGYDVVNLINKCQIEQSSDVNGCLKKIQTNQGIAGTANQVLPSDFVVTMHLEKVN